MRAISRSWPKSKKASPSKGIIRTDFDALGIAKIYAENGAAALSVLTDEKFFGGSADDLTRISHAVGRPILRKDFTIDPYQICEARALGASAVLLIVSILTPGELSSFLATSRALGLDALVEVHDQRGIDGRPRRGRGNHWDQQSEFENI